MKSDAREALPIYVVTDAAGRQLHVVLSVSTFRVDGDDKLETLLPVVESTLNLAQQLSGADMLVSFYLHTAPADVVVRRIRNVVKRTFEADKTALWIRADAEHYIKAVVNVIQVDYPHMVEITATIQEAAA